MSVVGPRPVVADELAFYGVHVCDYTSVRPGLTGAWQVSGRSNTTYDERVALDVHYIRHASLREDLSIIMRTFGAILGQTGAH
jgi:exopolysaccharide production protein ExoY